MSYCGPSVCWGKSSGFTYLDNLLVRHAGQEDVLLVIVWMELHNVGNFAITEPFDALASFGIPKFHCAVISTG